MHIIFENVTEICSLKGKVHVITTVIYFVECIFILFNLIS